jgi:hypothetical protein
MVKVEVHTLIIEGLAEVLDFLEVLVESGLESLDL